MSNKAEIGKKTLLYNAIKNVEIATRELNAILYPSAKDVLIAKKNKELNELCKYLIEDTSHHLANSLIALDKNHESDHHEHKNSHNKVKV